jgi:hypothetical protein
LKEKDMKKMIKTVVICTFISGISLATIAPVMAGPGQIKVQKCCGN